ncbi:MAG: SoxR reducing system RseC family protein [Thiohalomonadaceae bacterium]
MIEETVQVYAAEGETAWVEVIQRKTSCGQCVARSGCGTSALSKVLGQRRLRMAALNPIGARPGDRVIIGLRDDALVRGSVAVYLVPLLAMLAAALIGDALAPGQDLAVALAGLMGLAAGFGWVHVFGRRAAADPRYRPVILRQASVEFSPVRFR